MVAMTPTLVQNCSDGNASGMPGPIQQCSPKQTPTATQALKRHCLSAPFVENSIVREQWSQINDCQAVSSNATGLDAPYAEAQKSISAIQLRRAQLRPRCCFRISMAIKETESVIKPPRRNDEVHRSLGCCARRCFHRRR